MKYLIAVFLLLCVVSIHAQMPWQNIRHSALDSNGYIYIRSEISTLCETSFFYETEAGLVQQELETLPLLPITSQTSISVYDDLVRYYGFVSVVLDPLPNQPAVFSTLVNINNFTHPQLENLTFLANDPQGDIYQEETFLDITSVSAAYDQDKLYYAIQNNGGGFPVSETAWGPFFSYMLMITSADVNDIPFGMLYSVEQPPYIQPGLYKITGISIDDLQFISDIEIIIDEANNQLILSCFWEDLLADPDFNSWFDPENPEIYYSAHTNKITMSGGIEDADMTDPCCIYPIDCGVQSQLNYLPDLSDVHLTESYQVAATYQDDNANFPLTASAFVDDSVYFDLIPLSFDYTEPVIFQSLLSHPSLQNDTWETILVSVSDNNIDFVEFILENESSIEPDLPEISPLSINVYPNPFNPSVTISCNFLPKLDCPFELIIYNLRGQIIKVFTLDQYNSRIIWDGTELNNKPVASGIYFSRVQTKGSSATAKMLLLR